MEIGSDAHRELFCAEFHAAHLSYDPESFPLPALEERHLDFLRRIPLWGRAITDETASSDLLGRLAGEIDDPMVRAAVELQAFEERRHADLIRHMLREYGIEPGEVVPRALPEDVRRGFVEFGFAECVDAFAGGGFMHLVRETGILPAAFLDMIDRVLDEETQHTVFFVNCVAWDEARKGRTGPLARGRLAMGGYAAAFQRISGLADVGGETQAGYLPSGVASVLSDLTLEKVLAACVAENDRRLANISPDLLRPRFMPTMARLALPVVRRLPQALNPLRGLVAQLAQSQPAGH